MVFTGFTVSAASDYIGEAIIDPMTTGVMAAPACPDDGRTIEFIAAVENNDVGKMNFYIAQHGCIALFAESHGEIVGASECGSLLEIKMTYFAQDEHDGPVRVFVDAVNLRDMNGRKNGYMMGLWRELNGYE
ncbi:MAG: hypothetical protein COB39_05515 [Marinosulfonomonas sp.]|nr:MAG: hypothetical protein COB39_05515 [Marinosulfonomonas sp.]